MYGANAGQSAISTFIVKPNARIISFEPNPVIMFIWSISINGCYVQFLKAICIQNS
jgi:hypothetical protein